MDGETGELLDVGGLDAIRSKKPQANGAAARPPRKPRVNGAAHAHPQNDYIHPRLEELDFSEGNRNNSLNTGVLRRASWGRPFDDIVGAARNAGLPEREIDATIASASEAGAAELAQHPERQKKRKKEGLLVRLESCPRRITEVDPQLRIPIRSRPSGEVGGPLPLPRCPP